MYQWLLAFHIIAVIAWMAGMLYLPRLFVYHSAATPGSELSETLKVMERRLLHAKLALVLAMSALHDRFARWQKDFAVDRNRRPARFYRLANEIPTLLMIAIVVLVIVKPF